MKDTGILYVTTFILCKIVKKSIQKVHCSFYWDVNIYNHDSKIRKSYIFILKKFLLSFVLRFSFGSVPEVDKFSYEVKIINTLAI